MVVVQFFVQQDDELWNCESRNLFRYCMFLGKFHRKLIASIQCVLQMLNEVIDPLCYGKFFHIGGIEIAF